MDKTSLGDRIKHNYEDVYRLFLPNRLPIIIRLDGRSWHQYVKGCQKPFDQKLIDALNETAIYLCSNIQGAKFAYLQSDEISLLIYNPNFETEGWFNNNFQKMISVAAAMASSYFTSISHHVFGKTKIAQFDARAFVVPADEVVNVFEWRQQDATRNSIQMMARSIYSHSECNNKNCNELQELIFQKNVNWNDLPTAFKRGRCIIKKDQIIETQNPKTGEIFKTSRSKWSVDNEIPIFHKDRNYIEQFVYPADVGEI